jgi:hypothetical protein
MAEEMFSEKKARDLVSAAFQGGTGAVHDRLLGTPEGRAALYSFVYHLQATARDAIEEIGGPSHRDFDSMTAYHPPEVSSVVQAIHEAYPWYERALRFVEIDAANDEGWITSETPLAHIPLWCADPAIRLLSRMAKKAYRAISAKDSPASTEAPPRPAEEQAIENRLSQDKARTVLQVYRRLVAVEQDWIAAGDLDSLGIPTETVYSASQNASQGKAWRGTGPRNREYSRSWLVGYVVERWNPKGR